MRKTIYLFSIACLFIFLTSCGYKEGITQPSSNSYLKFTGNTHNALVIIDDSNPFPIQTSNENGRVIHYQLSPGKHRIIVKRNNDVVLNREVLIGNGMTKEINIKWKK